MILDKNLEIRAYVANRIPLKGDGFMHGDVYDSLDRMLEEHPDAAPLFGACVVHRTTGTVAEGYDDFYNSIGEAYQAWVKRSVHPFRLTLEYDGRSSLRICYNDGSDDEQHVATTVDAVRELSLRAVDTALDLKFE